MAVARLLTASNVSYVDKIVASGATKDIYFTDDKQSALAIYRDPKVLADGTYRSRLKALLTNFNLALPRSQGGAARDAEEAARMQQLFCWPTAITVSPGLGFVSPIFPERFWFHGDPRNLPRRDLTFHREKQAVWFTRRENWRGLLRRERGDLRLLLRAGILLSHAVSRLHSMGLAHSDLSPNNILIDPLPSTHPPHWPGCMVIDLDTVVVPGFFPAAVIGTRGYVAPEVLASSRQPPERQIMPSKATDRHALAVLLYELLLVRHPLYGPKIRNPESEEEDDFLAYGEQAIFIENPSDTSNRPKKLQIGYERLGAHLASLFNSAFVAGLHTPEARPIASEWESALWQTLDLLCPCANSTCMWKFLVYEGDTSACPWCGWRLEGAVPTLEFMSVPGVPDRKFGRLACWPGQSVHRWHLTKNGAAVPLADQEPYAEIEADADSRNWFIRNHRIDGLKLTSPSSKPIPRGGRVQLVNGATLLLGSADNARMARFCEGGQ